MTEVSRGIGSCIHCELPENLVFTYTLKDVETQPLLRYQRNQELNGFLILFNNSLYVLLSEIPNPVPKQTHNYHELEYDGL